MYHVYKFLRNKIMPVIFTISASGSCSSNILRIKQTNKIHSYINRNLLVCLSVCLSMALNSMFLISFHMTRSPWLAFLKCLPCLLGSADQQTTLYQVDQVLAQQGQWYLQIREHLNNSKLSLLAYHTFLFMIVLQESLVGEQKNKGSLAIKGHTRSKALCGSKTNNWPGKPKIISLRL